MLKAVRETGVRASERNAASTRAALSALTSAPIAGTSATSIATSTLTVTSSTGRRQEIVCVSDFCANLGLPTTSRLAQKLRQPLEHLKSTESNPAPRASGARILTFQHPFFKVDDPYYKQFYKEFPKHFPALNFDTDEGSPFSRSRRKRRKASLKHRSLPKPAEATGYCECCRLTYHSGLRAHLKDSTHLANLENERMWEPCTAWLDMYHPSFVFRTSPPSETSTIEAPSHSDHQETSSLFPERDDDLPMPTYRERLLSPERPQSPPPTAIADSIAAQDKTKRSASAHSDDQLAPRASQEAPTQLSNTQVNKEPMAPSKTIPTSPSTSEHLDNGPSPILSARSPSPNPPRRITRRMSLRSDSSKTTNQRGRRHSSSEVELSVPVAMGLPLLPTVTPALGSDKTIEACDRKPPPRHSQRSRARHSPLKQVDADALELATTCKHEHHEDGGDVTHDLNTLNDAHNNTSPTPIVPANPVKKPTVAQEPASAAQPGVSPVEAQLHQEQATEIMPTATTADLDEPTPKRSEETTLHRRLTKPPPSTGAEQSNTKLGEAALPSVHTQPPSPVDPAQATIHPVACQATNDEGLVALRLRFMTEVRVRSRKMFQRAL
ncbi:uncharacterized protein MONBRDRAFT_23915 [Monosiga brevicollis MX1]|uniref:DBF4-type domain-containing protein n=1 Tax=Monosiga brevicollis TaxID=81824 RepID=A9UV78_MONBE|nr:uncharacterized protein MONBRDRAFT_23915 [Monosiga brevicollis MX1]EDQ90848.1 predicted protein [Monosiga brevicollis MX1]|eukprot:XP_001744145.1 hypothetical protein [Monosiga brevicollis MX1]